MSTPSRPPPSESGEVAVLAEGEDVPADAVLVSAARLRWLEERDRRLAEVEAHWRGLRVVLG